jgi:hypothetical protein
LDKHKKFIHQIFASSHSSFNVFLLKKKSKTFMECFTASPASGKRQEEKHATLNPNIATTTPLEFITNPLLNLFDRCHSGAFAD